MKLLHIGKQSPNCEHQRAVLVLTKINYQPIIEVLFYLPWIFTGPYVYKRCDRPAAKRFGWRIPRVGLAIGIAGKFRTGRGPSYEPWSGSSLLLEIPMPAFRKGLWFESI